MNHDFYRALLEEYRSAMHKTGQSFKCLSEDGCAEDSFCIDRDGESVTVRVSGPLDGLFGASASMIIAELDEAKPSEINLLIESPGGLVREGISLYSDLRARADNDGVKINTESRGVVASAAVLPYLAGDDRKMGDGAMLMVHNPWAFIGGIGDYETIQKAMSEGINGLKAHTENFADIVARRTGMKKNDAKSAMGKTTWYNAEQAKSSGYASEVSAGPMNSVDVQVVDNMSAHAISSILKQFKGNVR